MWNMQRTDAVPKKQSRVRNRRLWNAFAAAILVTSLTCATPGASAEAGKSSKQKHNEEAVKSFYETALNQKNFEGSVKYLAPKYIQHNPQAEDGVEGFKKFIEYLNANAPQSHWEIKQVFSDGDFVILHILQKFKPEDHGSAVIDIFRLENGKIAEHWDVIQMIPEQSANNNTMF